MPDTLGQLLKETRLAAGRKQHEIGEAIDADRNYVAGVENGRIKRADRDRLVKWAAALGLDVAQVLSVGGYDPTLAAAPLVSATDPDALADRIASRVVEALERARGIVTRERPIVRYEAEQVASAGTGSLVEGEAWVVESANPGRAHRVIVVPVRGDCLEPDVRDGERVAVDTGESARPGDLVLADHDNESLVKYLEKRRDGLYLVALNGQPAIKIDPEEVVGPVTQVMRRPPRRRTN